MPNHLSVRVYPSKDVVYNVVSDEDLQSHIDYNKNFRFGCLLYIDGKRVSDGCMREEVLSQYDEFYAKWFKTIGVNINISKVTRPLYR